jgi:hypothetical protein
MWKRIQNLYLLASTALIIALFFCKVGTVPGETGKDAIVHYYEVTAYLIMNIMLLTANILALCSLRNPMLQARVSIISALLMIGMQIWLVVDFFRFKEIMIFSITTLFPLLGAFLNFMAARNAMIDGFTIQAVSKKRNKSRKAKK